MHNKNRIIFIYGHFTLLTMLQNVQNRPPMLLAVSQGACRTSYPRGMPLRMLTNKALGSDILHAKTVGTHI